MKHANILRSLLLLAAFVLAPSAFADDVPLHWVGDAPRQARPVSFGIPFRKGEMTLPKAKAAKKGKGETPATSAQQTLTLKVGDAQVPADFWPLAYWPDGSVKWGGVAAVVPATGQGGSASVSFSAQPFQVDAAQMLRAETKGGQIVVHTGPLDAFIPLSGNSIADSLVLDGRQIAGRGLLTCAMQNEASDGALTDLKMRHFEGHVEAAELERVGAVRAVVKLTGRYRATDASQQQLLPFTVRLYFYAGSPQVRMVHTFVYDGDQDRDFIRSLAVRWMVPMREQAYNRHVAFATQDGGVWAESVQPLSGRRVLNNDESLELQQVAGQRIPEPATFDEKGQDLLHHWARWNSYRLSQPNDMGFTIQKRAHHNNSWIGTASGHRAQGYAFVGDVSGGLGVAVKDFWQSYPASLQVDSAATDEAMLTAYLWSPDAPAMDLRHYDNVAHDLNASYEDVQPGMSTPYGIARTSELTFLPELSYPGKAAVAAIATGQADALPLLPTPQYLHDRQAFGVWSLPNHSTDKTRAVEKILKQYLIYYIRAREEHHWYGFWHYGDFMHQYDPARHEWKYDVGGFAWDNTELGSISWLWYSFLRTGEADVWRMAEAMARHTSEVDVYHAGPFEGLGTRHNVSHWGCGAKEARISQAAWNRFYYYLTTDERTGDLMTAVKDAEQRLYTLDPMRLALPREKYPCTAPARLRIGPDWLAYAGNWLTQYERTGEKHYRDMLLSGMKSIKALPKQMFSGPGVLGFDPATGVLSWEGDPEMEHTNHLMAIMGGFELMHELNEMFPDAAWQKAWLDYCAQYDKKTTNAFRISRLKAYAAWKLGDRELANEAWRDMMTYSKKTQHYEFREQQVTRPEVPSDITESPLTTTNDCALWSLEAIFMQEVIPQ